MFPRQDKCNLDMLDELPFHDELPFRKHKWNLVSLPKAEIVRDVPHALWYEWHDYKDVPETEQWCELCQNNANGPAQWKDHVMGRQHVSRVLRTPHMHDESTARQKEGSKEQGPCFFVSLQGQKKKHKFRVLQDAGYAN